MGTARAFASMAFEYFAAALAPPQCAACDEPVPVLTTFCAACAAVRGRDRAPGRARLRGRGGAGGGAREVRGPSRPDASAGRPALAGGGASRGGVVRVRRGPGAAPRDAPRRARV